MQAVLQAAYIRQLLGVPPAGSNYPAPAQQQQRQQQQGSTGGGAAAAGAAGKVEVQSVVAESGKMARSSLQPFISQASQGCAAWLLQTCSFGHLVWTQLNCGAVSCSPSGFPSLRHISPCAVPPVPQLQEQGWQLSPFMLSSTEKQRFLRL